MKICNLIGHTWTKGGGYRTCKRCGIQQRLEGYNIIVSIEDLQLIANKKGRKEGLLWRAAGIPILVMVGALVMSWITGGQSAASILFFVGVGLLLASLMYVAKKERDYLDSLVKRLGDKEVSK